MWRMKRTSAAIGAVLGLSIKQVEHMRPALGLEPRNKERRKRAYVLMEDQALALLTARASAAGIPRQRFLAMILEREAKCAEVRA